MPPAWWHGCLDIEASSKIHFPAFYAGKIIHDWSGLEAENHRGNGAHNCIIISTTTVTV